MKYYQIVESSVQAHHAGSKATDDVAVILKEQNFKEIIIRKANEKTGAFNKLFRQLIYVIDWKKAYKSIENNSVVVLQHPFHNKQVNRNNVLKKLKENKQVKFISIVHDIEELRNMIFNQYYEKEFDFMLNIADVLVVHNDVMKQFLIQKGVDEDCIVVLEIFDYLMPYNTTKKIEFSKSITVAGNLDSRKSPYVKFLTELSDIAIDLYGPNFSVENIHNKKVVYHGSFPPEEIPNKLSKGFGLVWDGSSIETCTDNTGNYLRYNSPHKLSLYLASGLPVFVWKESAGSRIVLNHHLGIVINSITDIPNILNCLSVEEYKEYIKNVENFAIKLHSGYFTKNAIRKSIQILQEEP